jgi:hypothetical protein
MGWIAAVTNAAARNNLTPFVETYDNSKDFQRAASKLLGKGWTVTGQSQDNGRFTMTRLALLGPFALAAKKGRGKVTVTWMPPS